MALRADFAGLTLSSPFRARPRFLVHVEDGSMYSFGDETSYEENTGSFLLLYWGEEKVPAGTLFLGIRLGMCYFSVIVSEAAADDD